MKKILSLLAFTLVLGACEQVETYDEVDNDYMHNFDAAWNIINENYCFLGYKNIDWDKIYEEYRPRVENAKDQFEFFDIMSNLVDVLRDGHSAIVSNFDKHGSNYAVEPNGEPSPKDYISSDVVAGYLLKRRVTKNNFVYGFIEQGDRKLAYLAYPDFSVELGDEDLEYIAPLINEADGLIVDVRNNSGGAAIYGLSFAARFFSEQTLVGYTARKNGAGYDDFTSPSEINIEPSATNNWSDKPTMLLVNRGVYSTTNLVACALKLAPNVTLVGGRSGGGGGLPETYYLPNGWVLVLPSNVIYDTQLQHIENGIEPDVEIHISTEDKNKEKDTILEKAIELLMQ